MGKIAGKRQLQGKEEAGLMGCQCPLLGEQGRNGQIAEVQNATRTEELGGNETAPSEMIASIKLVVEN